jgi:LacI family transcriptional regulator
MNKKITQKELALQLGVSQTLVSMVLNGRQEGISPKRFKMIWNKALEAGYSPRGMDISQIKSDASREPGEVGILIRSGVSLNLKSNFFSHVYQGLHSEAIKHKLCTMYLGNEDDFTHDEIVDLLKTRDLLGMVIFGEIKPELLIRLKSIGMQMVAVSAEYPGFCDSIISNESESAELLVNHLYSLGHRNFGWIGGNVGHGRHRDRFNALMMTLRKYELLLPEKNCVDLAEADRLEGREAVEQLVNRLGIDNLPTAIICHNGTMARGAVNYLLQNQVKIPQYVSIAAIDMTRISYEEYPGITSASAFPEKMGAKAMERLLEIASRPEGFFPPRQIVLKSRLEIRDSSAECLR